jgi:hypothetical protein
VSVSPGLPPDEHGPLPPLILHIQSYGGPNPTLTAQALATRTAEKIVTRYLGGDPGVRREAPISSIDDRVTRAVMRRGLGDTRRRRRARP